MKNELFDKFFGPPMNMPIPTQIPNTEGVNYVFLGGGFLILVLLYKLNSKKIIKEKKDTV
jgi:hypothetical protein